MEYRRRRRNNANVSLKDHKNIGLSNISGLKFLSGKELTRDHHPDREDERRRIEAAGGSVVSGTTGVPRVNGQLAVSRSIGDICYKKYVSPFNSSLNYFGRGFYANRCVVLLNELLFLIFFSFSITYKHTSKIGIIANTFFCHHTASV